MTATFSITRLTGIIQTAAIAQNTNRAKPKRYNENDFSTPNTYI